MANYAQFFKSTENSAPTLTGQVGSVITLLNKILVDGYATASVTSITRKGTGNLTALVLMASANTTLYNGTVISVTGCTGTGATQFNITAPIKFHVAWQASTNYAQGALVDNGSNTYVCTVAGQSAGSGGPTGTGTGIADNTCTWDFVDTTTNNGKYFTYQVASDPGASASGTPVYAKAGLQWTRPFAAGTNSQTYRSADATSNQFYLQVIDNGATAGGAKEAQVFGAEVMSADQAVTSGRFPTTAQGANGKCFRKSTTADNTTRAWTAWGDDRTFFIVVNTGDSAGQNVHDMCFGYFPSYKAGDGFNTFMGAPLTFNSSAVAVCGATVSGIGGAGALGTNFHLPRSYTQIGSSIAAGLGVFGQTGSALASGIAVGNGSSFLAYPHPVDSGLYVVPAFICESFANNASILRGRMPSIYVPLHGSPFSSYDESTGVNGLAGVTLVAINVSDGTNTGQVLADKFGLYL